MTVLSANLAALPLSATRRSRRQPARWAAIAVMASLAATLFLVLQPKQRSATSPDLEPPSSSKGTALALEVVRMDPQGQLLEPTKFAAGDRFKLLISCPERHERALRVLVFQAGQVFEPVPAQELTSCGNRRPLQGAWQLDGTDPIDQCVVFGREAQRQSLRSAKGLPQPHVCARLNPADATKP